MTPVPPCRLHGILARDAPVGVLFRRGPTRWVRLIRWDVANDRFEHGHWFHGKIDPERADLSPDGKYLVYIGYKPQNWHRDKLDHWVAVSRPPWLTAVAFWPGYGPWTGGGWFEADGTLVSLDRTESEVAGAFPFPVRVGTDEEFLRRYEPILHSWGSVRLQQSLPELPDTALLELARVIGGSVSLKARVGPQSTVLIRREDPRDRRMWSYALWLPEGRLKVLHGVTWADWDQRDRLAYAREGRLWVTWREGGKRRKRCLAGFNVHRPTDIPPPDWARTWTEEPG